MTTTISPRMIEDARAEAELLEAGVALAEEELGRTSALTATARAGLDSLDEEISAQSALVSRHDLEQGRLDGVVAAAESRRTATRAELAVTTLKDLVKIQTMRLGDVPLAARKSTFCLLYTPSSRRRRSNRYHAPRSESDGDGSQLLMAWTSVTLGRPITSAKPPCWWAAG